MNIWYASPAPYWEGALPIGNGKQGAMVFGGVEEEQLQLNEDTIWSGPGEYEFDKDTPEKIRFARSLLREKRYTETEAYVQKEILLPQDECQSYQTAGSLNIQFRYPDSNGPVEYTGYRRSLSLSEAIATTSYTVADTEYNHEAFASFPGKVLAYRISASKPASVNFATSFTSPMPRFSVHSLDSATASTRGIAASMNPDYTPGRMDIDRLWDEASRKRPAIRYTTVVRVATTGSSAKVCVSDGSICVKNADDAILYIHTATGFQGYDKDPVVDANEIEKRAVEIIEQAMALGYTPLKEAHVADHSTLFDRMSLELGSTDASALPTDQRLGSCSHPKDDPGLVELLFQYGRYLLIASSRPGGEPANLQGIWNRFIHAPWGGRYTININTEMNYWPARVCNLAECETPYLTMVEELSQAGRLAAEELYGCRGWCSHHNTDIWRWNAFVHFRPQHAYFPLSGAWLARNVWEKYLYDGDLDYLQATGFPILAGSCRFILDYLTEDAEGRLVTSPATSPENVFADPATGERVSMSEGSTIDQTIVVEIFEHTLAAAKALQEASATDNFADGWLVDFAGGGLDELSAALKKVRRPVVGDHGRLLEFSDDFDEPDPHHRHVSHLYGVYPGAGFTPDRNKDLYDGARASLERRGDESTGWGMGWRVALWARFLDGDHALDVVGNLLNLVVPDGRTNYGPGGGVYINLMDAHPPFQIDGNFGVTAGIAEMLMQSHCGTIRLLPALPKAWPDGQIRGLCARGGFEIDIHWASGKLGRCTIRSISGNTLCITCAGSRFESDTAPGDVIELRGDLTRST